MSRLQRGRVWYIRLLTPEDIQAAKDLSQTIVRMKYTCLFDISDDKITTLRGILKKRGLRPTLFINQGDNIIAYNIGPSEKLDTLQKLINARANHIRNRKRENRAPMPIKDWSALRRKSAPARKNAREELRNGTIILG